MRLQIGPAARITWQTQTFGVLILQGSRHLYEGKGYGDVHTEVHFILQEDQQDPYVAEYLERELLLIFGNCTIICPLAPSEAVHYLFTVKVKGWLRNPRAFLKAKKALVEKAVEAAYRTMSDDLDEQRQRYEAGLSVCD